MNTTELRQTVAGGVYLPGEPGYDDEIATFNLAFRHTPDLVVAARSAEDVAAAVGWAGERCIPVGVQATGHGPTSPVTEGVLVSTRGMDHVHVDPEARTARVDAGVKWRRLLDAAAEHGLAGLCGSTSDVGVVGYTLGGGLPVLGRSFGFCSDHVRRFEVVTGDGSLHEVAADDDSELAWALRGGKGNVGIVTSMELDLIPVSDIYGGGIFYRGEDTPAVLRRFAEWTTDLPEEFNTSLALLRLPAMPDIPQPLRGQFVAHLRVAYLGDDDAGARLLAPMRAAAEPMIDTVGRMPYAQLDSIHQDPDHPVPAYEGSTLLRDLGPAPVDTLLEYAGPGADCPLLQVEIRLMGGALSRAGAGAVGGRDAAYALILIGIMAPPFADLVPAGMRTLIEAMAPYSTGGSMVNLHGVPGDAADRARPWSGATFERLQRAKATYDPANLFRFGHAVPALEPA
jgi:FAD/FMN-containing dehydrogenase